MAEIRYDGRVAIVTGAGMGIGRMYALELARRGAKVVVNDLGGSRDGSGANQSAADSVVKEIKDAGGEATANYDSVATYQGGQNIVQTALDAYGKVDILINNAGILRDRSFLKMSEEEWDLVIAVHLKGAFCVTQPAVKVMKDNNYGRIVFTSSTSGLYGNFGQTNYGAAKLGLVGIMNTLKLEVAKYDIKVNTIAPNAWSRMTADVFPPEFEQKMNPQFNEP
ncbi:MAG: SDR family oxidoreductase, partial [bacterium]